MLKEEKSTVTQGMKRSQPAPTITGTGFQNLNGPTLKGHFEGLHDPRQGGFSDAKACQEWPF